MAIVNLLEETIEKLERCGLTTADVKWVGWANGWQAVDWKTFTGYANREYDNESESPQVHHYLVVVGEDWWLERETLNTVETRQAQWVYHSLPVLMKKEQRSQFFFAFEDEEQITLKNLAYQEDLKKLERFLYGE